MLYKSDKNEYFQKFDFKVYLLRTSNYVCTWNPLSWSGPTEITLHRNPSYWFFVRFICRNKKIDLRQPSKLSRYVRLKATWRFGVSNIFNQLQFYNPINIRMVCLSLE